MRIIPNQENVNRKKQKSPPGNKNCHKHNNKIQTKIDVFPNPTIGNFCISNKEIPDAVIITNALGNEVMRIKPISTKEYIDMSEMANGIYYLITITNKGQQVTKLVLNK